MLTHLPDHGADINRFALASRDLLSHCPFPLRSHVLADLLALWLANLPEPTRDAALQTHLRSVHRLLAIYTHRETSP